MRAGARLNLEVDMLARYLQRLVDRSRQSRVSFHDDRFRRLRPSIEEARNGRMFILVDDEDRENEGDLVIPAQMATPRCDQFHGASTAAA